MMKKCILLCVSALLLSGCVGAGTKSNETTQALTMENRESTQEIISTDTSIMESTTNVQASDSQVSWEDYYIATAQAKAMDLDVEILEDNYRSGNVDKDSYLKEKTAKEAQEDLLEKEENRIENLLLGTAPSIDLSVQGKSKEELLQLKQQNETQQDALELEGDQLERDYRSGSIDRAAFIEKQIELERKDSILDAEEDVIEKSLLSL